MASKQRKLQQSGTNPEKNQPIPTAGELFPDGSAIELVRSDAQLALLKWDGHRATQGVHAEHEGREYVPATIDPSVLRALRLPTRAATVGSAQQLFADICALFERHRFTDEVARLLTYSVFSTWLVDCLPSAPCLWIVTPDGTDGTALMRLLAALARRSLLLGEVTRAGLLALPLDLQLTLLIEQHKLSRPLQYLLSASRTRGLGVPVGGKLRDVFGARVLCSGHDLERFVCEGAIRVSLAPQAGVPVLTEEEIEEIAGEFQPKLLGYRLAQHHKTRASKFDVAEFTAPMRLLARSLGACVVDDPGLQGGLLPLLRGQDEALRAERSAGMEAVAIEAVLFYIHEGERASVYVNEIAKVMSAILQNRGESFGLEDRAVGGILNRLGLHTGRLGGRGRGIRLQQSVRRKAHDLARQYELSIVDSKVFGCADCVAVGGLISM